MRKKRTTDYYTPQAELRGHLARLSMTQEGLAMMLGVHLRTLARWLAEGPVPRVAIFACRYLEAIGVGGRIRILREFNNRGK